MSNVLKLSPALKQLIAVRSFDPTPVPHPSKFLPALSATLSEARRKKAERGWLAAATATCIAKNSPASVADLYRFIVRADLLQNPKGDSHGPSLSTARAHAALMREAALKSMVFVGVAGVINCLEALTGALEQGVKDGLEKKALRTTANIDSPESTRERGRKLFDAIYTPHTDKLIRKLGSYHPDFSGAILDHEYGAILSDPPNWPAEGTVGRTLTSVVGVACLRASGGLGPQLTSHVYGLLKARDSEEFDSASESETWLVTEEGATWVLQTVDKICDTFMWAWRYNGPLKDLWDRRLAFDFRTLKLS